MGKLQNQCKTYNYGVQHCSKMWTMQHFLKEGCSLIYTVYFQALSTRWEI